MEHELRHKLENAGLPGFVTQIVRHCICIAYPNCLIVTTVTGLELEAQLTLNLLIAAPHAMNPDPVHKDRKNIRLLSHMKDTWQLVFTDGTCVDIRIKLL